VPTAWAVDPGVLVGRWKGAFSRHGSIQIIDVRLERRGDTVVGHYDIPEMGLFEEPLSEVVVGDSTVSIRLLYGPFDLYFQEGYEQLTALNERWNPPVSLHLKKVAGGLEPQFTSEAVSFTSGGSQLAGTLVRPLSPGPHPALVAIPGSGNQGRTTWEYRSHAYALARQGIAVLLYDKRGVGESEGSLSSADFTTMANDATAALNSLRGRSDVAPGRVGFLGISQGGWVAAIASRLGAEPDFIVFLEGPSVSLEAQELHRVEYSLRAEGYAESAIDSAVSHTRTYFAFVNSPQDWKSLEASTQTSSKAAWAEFVNLPATQDDTDIAWWRQNAYDPAEDLQALSCPVLAVFGEVDPNVPPAENVELMKQYLSRAGVEFEVVIIPGLPHSVTTYQTLLGGEWNWPQHYWVWSRRPTVLDSSMGAWVWERVP